MPASTAAAPEVPASAPAPAAAPTAPAAPGPEGGAQAPDEPAPPCIDGEILMGACICERGRGADATGHCVYPPCPSSTTGGVVFRDEATGQCKECRPGTKPTKDGTCER